LADKSNYQLAIVFYLLNYGSGGLPTSDIRITFNGTRTDNQPQSAPTTNNFPLVLIALGLFFKIDRNSPKDRN